MAGEIEFTSNYSDLSTDNGFSSSSAASAAATGTAPSSTRSS